MPKLSIQEQEVHICIDEESKLARLYCSSSRWMKKLDKVAERVRVHKQGRSIVAAEYELPEKYIKVSKPRKLNLTDEQRAAASERMKKARNKK